LYSLRNKIAEVEQLKRRHISLINTTDTNFKRYLFNKLPWSEKFIGIKGSRGVGKTTLLLHI